MRLYLQPVRTSSLLLISVTIGATLLSVVAVTVKSSESNTEYSPLLEKINRVSAAIGKRPAPGIVPLDRPQQSLLTFGMSEYDYNRLRLYVGVDVFKNLPFTPGQPISTIFGQSFVKHVNASITSFKTLAGVDVPPAAHSAVRGFACAIFVGKIIASADGSPTVDLSRGRGGKSYLEVANDMLRSTNPRGACGHTAIVLTQAMLACGLGAGDAGGVARFDLEPYFSGPTTTPKQAKDELKKFRATIGHQWNYQEITGGPANGKSIGVSFLLPPKGPRMYRDATWLHFNREGADFNGGAWTDEQALEAIVSKLYLVDANTPELAEMFWSQHYFIKGRGTNIDPLVKAAVDKRRLKASFNFYGQVTSRTLSN